jgi:hypothetical protein
MIFLRTSLIFLCVLDSSISKTRFVIYCRRNYVNAISVYDSVRNSWHLLPPIPSGINGVPEECGCVSLGGKLYIIGGRGRGPLELRDKVYAFDFVGKARWKQCASMITGRAAVACEAKDGKIYVCQRGCTTRL